MDKKRERGKNYIETDKQNLLEIVHVYIKIVENKQTDAVSVKMKNEIWEKISMQYSAMAQTGPRTANQLKLLYETIKKKVKKDKANEKMELYKTGGGSFISKIDAVGEKFLQMSGHSIEIKNQYDSTAPYDEPCSPGIVRNTEDLIEELPMSIADLPITFLNNHEWLEVEDPEPDAVLPPALPEIVTKEIPVILSEEPKKHKTYKPTMPNFNKRKASQIQSVTNTRTEEQQLKLDILKIRKEKEEIEKDILLLKKKQLTLEIEEKRQKLQNDHQ